MRDPHTHQDEEAHPAGAGACRLVAVRHGATAWSRALRHTGRTDLDLEPEGRTQAEDVGRRLAGHRFARVLVSPLARARDTGRLAGFPRAEVDEDLREWDYGAYEGRTTAEIQGERPGWSLWRDGVPGGETLDEVATRADRVVDAVRSTAGDVLVFAHGHILRVVAARWLGLPAESGSHLALATGTISVLGWERTTPVVQSWNDPDGDPL